MVGFRPSAKDCDQDVVHEDFITFFFFNEYQPVKEGEAYIGGVLLSEI